MTVSKLEQLRAKLRAQEEAKNTSKTFTPLDNALYPFYNMPMNAAVSVRFLPDKTDEDLQFHVEAQKITLTFPSIKGQTNDSGKDIIVRVPCMATYGKTCPITEEIRPWWDDDEMKPLASQYYRKQEFIYQGFVRGASPVPEENTPENPIRRFVFNKRLHDSISTWKTLFMDGEFDNLPTDFNNGTDFTLRKTQNGQWPSYDTSSWARKESALTEAELEAINTHGLYNLRDYIPNEPNEQQLQAIIEMFEASVNGDPYDPDKWADYYKPWGLDRQNNKSEKTTTTQTTVSVPKTQATTPAVEAVEEKPVVETPTTTEASTSAKELLARLNANRSNNG